jgi:hypothetical protein
MGKWRRNVLGGDGHDGCKAPPDPMDDAVERVAIMFYVAMSEERPGCGGASVVADDVECVREFLEEYKEREIRFVDGKEMHRLMTI